MATQHNVDEALREHFHFTPTHTNLADSVAKDLWSGPLYTDGRGNWLCWGEPGARQFDFSRACGILSEWNEKHLPDSLYYEVWSGCLVEEPDWEEAEWGDYWAIGYDDIVRALYGQECLSYVR